MLRSTLLSKPVLLAATLLFIVGCAPIQLDPDALPQATPAATETAAPVTLEESPAMEAAMATSTTPSLILRRFPDEESPVIGELEQGESYKVIGISTDGTWVRLEVLDAPTGAGWVAARFVTVEGDITEVPITDGTGVAAVRPEAPENGAVILTDGTRLRVREEPSEDAEILTYAYDGEVYNVLEFNEDGTWVRIDAVGTENGGWVATEFLELGESASLNVSSTATLPITDPVTETVALTASTNLTETATATETASTTSTTVITNAVADATSDSTDGSADGSTDDSTGATEDTAEIAAEDDSAEADLAAPGPGEALVNTGGQRLRIRSEPNTDAEIIAYAADGEIYNVTELSVDGAWARLSLLEFENDGWAASQFLEFGGERNGGPLTVGAVSETLTETETISDGVEAAAPAPQETEPITDTDVVTATAPIAIEDLPTPGPGEAVVYTDGTRLRVRSEPNADTEENIVGYVYTGEVYPVLEISEDGLWVLLDIDGIEGGGWVYDIYVLTAE